MLTIAKTVRSVLLTGLALVFFAAGVDNATAQQRQGQRTVLIRDAEIEGLLRLYARPLFKVAGLNPGSVKVYVIANPKINAFVSNGQRIFVHTGLFTNTDTPNEVIGVLAHETGHISGGHLVRMTDELKRASAQSIIGMMIGAAAAIGGAATGSSEAAQVGQGIILGSQGTAQRNFLAYQRSMEAAADEAALRFLAATKQSGRGMLKVFDRLSREMLAASQNADPYVFSHPMPLDRVRTLSERVKASPYFTSQDSPSTQLRHDLVKAKILGYTETPQQVFSRYPTSDRSLPSRYARAVAMFRRGDIANSLPVIDSLIDDMPKNPYFWELKAQALLENGRAEEAIAPSQQARKLLPQQGLLLLLEAQAQLDSGAAGSVKTALALLAQAKKSESDNPQVYKLTAQAHAANRDVPRAELATAEFAYLVGDRNLAIEKARFAQSQFSEGSVEWLKASDILTAAQRKKK
jgi:predicted Zn-dependent protease